MTHEEQLVEQMELEYDEAESFTPTQGQEEALAAHANGRGLAESCVQVWASKEVTRDSILKEVMDTARYHEVITDNGHGAAITGLYRATYEGKQFEATCTKALVDMIHEQVQVAA